MPSTFPVTAGKLVEDKSGAVKKVTIQRKKRMDEDDSDLEGL